VIGLDGFIPIYCVAAPRQEVEVLGRKGYAVLSSRRVLSRRVGRVALVACVARTSFFHT